MRDGKLRVWNTIFKNNEGAAVGPDVAGGAIYTLGSLGTTIVGSTFQSNHAANGGAIGALFGNLSIYNSRFSSNHATGNGANSINSACHVGSGESGNGGNGGAVCHRWVRELCRQCVRLHLHGQRRRRGCPGRCDFPHARRRNADDDH